MNKFRQHDRDLRPKSGRWVLTLLLMICGIWCQVVQAETPEEEAYQRFRTGTHDLVTLAAVLPQMANADRRVEIRSSILDAESPPRAVLVSLLNYPVLAVRLGSLELLEELAGGDFGYNPWEAAQSPANIGSLKQWNAWAGKSEKDSSVGSIFSDDQRRGYLLDLMSDDEDKATRARRMLEAEGLSAVGYLEAFLKNTPTLPAGGRSRIRQAQYQITLSRQLGAQAAVCARHLSFGSRDQLLAAITTIRGAGLLAMPILQDFIQHSDPLVREVAVDSLLVCGGEDAVGVVAPLLAKEADVNVILGALRRLKDLPCKESKELLISMMGHEDEDLRITAIQACKVLKSEGKPDKSIEQGVLACLKDPRWRVRASALDFVQSIKLSAAKNQCLDLLDDKDDFVRFAAVKAVVAVAGVETLPRLKTMLMKDPGMLVPVIEAYSMTNQKLDNAILEQLDKAPANLRIAAIRNARSSNAMQDLLLRYATDADVDVACSVLRLIAADNDKIQQNDFASVLVHALRSGRREYEQAIFDRLDLSGESSGQMPSQLVDALRALEPDHRSAVLDPLYGAFKVVEMGGPSVIAPNAPRIPGAKKELIKELIKRCAVDAPLEIRFSAALNLAKTGNSEAYARLLSDLPSLSTAQKTTICNNLRNPPAELALPMLKSMLRDPVAEVRQAAVECALGNEKDKALAGMVLAELEDAKGKLQAHEAYVYQFDYAARKQVTVFRAWSLRMLNSTTASDPIKILATIAARHCANQEVVDALRKNTTAANSHLRRAAWHAMISARPAELLANAEAVAKDPEAFVRVVLPDRVAKKEYVWRHHFTDTNIVSDHHHDYNNEDKRIDDRIKVLLERLAAQDPSPLVRFEASMAVLGVRGAIDINDFVALLPQMSEETNALRRLSGWMEENAERATPAMKPLLAVVSTSRINKEKLKLLKSRILSDGGSGMVSFASLAEGAGQSPPDGALLLADGRDKSAADRQSIKVLFFYKPGCKECASTRELLGALKNDFPLLEVDEHNILETKGTELNQALCLRFDVPSARHSVAPAVFAQAGYVVGADMSHAALSKVLAETMKLPQDDAWQVVDEEKQEQAAHVVEERYENITLSIVVAGGLLDGINPCAFATIIFFLSYLQIARRTPREMLWVGVAFISAVFLAYLAAGLLLHQALDALSSRFAGIQRWMNYGFGVLALVAAWLSLRDARLARAGRLGDMALQLPGFLKERIRSVIRTGARARNFIIAAFISGLVVSLLELACTGQVYAPIIYQIQKGRLDAVLWLVIYNLAFITPLIVIFLMAYGGLRSESLMAWQKKHTFAVKLALAVLFLGLALVIFLST